MQLILSQQLVLLHRSFQIRLNQGLKKGKDFYMVGAMGHSSMVALGNSFFKKKFLFVLMAMVQL